MAGSNGDLSSYLALSNLAFPRYRVAEDREAGVGAGAVGESLEVVFGDGLAGHDVGEGAVHEDEIGQVVVSAALRLLCAVLVHGDAQAPTELEV